MRAGYSAHDFSEPEWSELCNLQQQLVGEDCANFSEPYISELPEAQRLILNDGTSTHLVHSTIEVAAERICVNGLTIPKLGHRPAPWVTTYMLEGPSGLAPQEPANRLLMDYQRGRSTEFPGNAKVVLTFPVPRPPDMDSKGTRRFPHAHSDLVKPDSPYLHQDADGGHFYPPEFVEGYFLHDEQRYVPNPSFYDAAAVGGLRQFFGRVRGFVGWHNRTSGGTIN
jgi:hypothetical protein